MSTFASSSPHATGFSGWLSRAEAWLDRKGKGAWIVVMIVAFIVAWPLGLALLAYMIWSKKMICSSARRRYGHRSVGLDHATGNTAFDAYRTETLARLEREQADFEAFMQRLRDARDKAEFDQFMDERARAATAEPQDDTDADAPRAG
jgi:hypothetical protein